MNSRACVSCGGHADAFCARCGVTPYCGPRCQRRDWIHRHRAVCHNLARLTNGEGQEPAPTSAPDAPVVEPVVPPVAPLRRPYSPAGQNVNRKQMPEQDTDDRQQKRFFPPGTNARSGQHNSNRGRQGFNNRGNRPRDNKSQDSRSQDNRPQHSRAQYNTSTRKPQTQQATETAEEEWDISGKQQPEQAEPKKQSPTAVNQSPVKQSPVKQNSQADKQASSEVKPAAAEVKAVEPEKSKDTKKIVKPATLDDVTPARKIVPKKCVIDLLSTGDIVMLSVDNKASECKSKSRGFVCLSLHENYESEYQALCDDYTADCEADTAKYTPNPGETFSYLNPEEGAWYRARCLNPTLAALIDSSKLVTLTPKDNLKRLSEKYANIPEFCCLLEGDKVQMGNNLKCTIVTKATEVCKVSIENAETGAVIGEGEVSRWLPVVDYPAPAAAPVAAGPTIPEVPRPDVENNSKVLLVEMTELKRAFVRRADAASQRKYDSVLHGVALYGQEATPMKEPPQKGQVVVAKFVDGMHYRALCKRTNVKQNKYLLEYIEFGNIEIATLENIYPCPAEFNLSAHPAEASIVSLQGGATVLTDAATQYIEKLKDSATELLLTICSGSKTAPSGAEVKLTVADTKESVNGKIEELCTPDWKKLEKSGGDVVETATLMYSDLTFLKLPETGCEIEVMDISSLEGAIVSGYMKGEPLAKKILEDLPIQMEAYCNSDIGREPYLPKFEELCVAQCPPYPQWFRAVLCEQVSGAGGDEARVCYVDYGNVDVVSVNVLRKMLPDFVKDLPALSAHLEIRDFPKDPTQEMLARAVEYMKINDEGRGVLKVSRCEQVEQGLYLVDAPGLIAAMKG
ncbi:unnamed protein product [Parnassius apollo]|uniref:(apollo) hypothetical protein n=1 Tax=Parnassius apollo TaxID=110799 RepID=A0A8S3X457_PARAO|nr:unnamed protein product [Parnassius apollo]